MTFPALFEETCVFTVSELNARIRSLLESEFPYVWVCGEVSNFRVPASGHFYFTLKDAGSQLRAVMFRAQQRRLRFEPEAGLQVLCQGRITVYEPRGDYQLIVDVMEPQGLGALQLAFEQLKKRLEAEGLFDPARKKPLPVVPQRIAVVTSPTGAAIRDILKVLQRSPYALIVTLIPVRVQGEGAAEEIARAIQQAGALRDTFRWDVILVGRGGGSLEDLWAFNEEAVARAVADCPIPTISCVGHEIDVTISDMAADLRAPTPTAAAQWIVGRLEGVERDLSSLSERLRSTLERRVQRHREQLHHLAKRLRDPRRRITDRRLYVDDRLERLVLAFSGRLARLRMTHGHLAERLKLHRPSQRIESLRDRVNAVFRSLCVDQGKLLERSRFQLEHRAAQLESLNPLAILGRGYSITHRMPDGKIVRCAREVKEGQRVQIRLWQGALRCVVEACIDSNDEPGQGRTERGEEEENNGEV